MPNLVPEKASLGHSWASRILYFALRRSNKSIRLFRANGPKNFGCWGILIPSQNLFVWACTKHVQAKHVQSCSECAIHLPCFLEWLMRHGEYAFANTIYDTRHSRAMFKTSLVLSLLNYVVTFFLGNVKANLSASRWDAQARLFELWG